jgi:hypothetical protein
MTRPSAQPSEARRPPLAQAGAAALGLDLVALGIAIAVVATAWLAYSYQWRRGRAPTAEFFNQPRSDRAQIFLSKIPMTTAIG